jgi:NADH dehydrogenase [ubiquinone] 1 alpha subcomplex assembly factor 2
MRRIVEYPRSLPYSEVTSLISPAWHQWLRHTRGAPPSLTEQAQDLVRQRQIKVLAAEADARWNSKESFLDAPRTAQVPGGTEAGARGVSAVTEGMRETGTGVRDSTAGKIATLAQDPERMKVQGAPPPRVYTNPGLAKKERQEKEERPIPKKDDPWEKAKRGGPKGPGEEWQPQAWNPSGATPRS